MRRWWPAWTAPALLLMSGAAVAEDQARLDAAARARVTRAVERSGFVGTYAVYAGPRRIAAGSAGPAIEGQPGGFGDAALWPWDGLGRQVAATLAMMEVEAGRLSLDAPLTRYWPGGPAGTLRQMIGQRRSDVVVAVLERTTRRSFADLFAQRIAGPLGLTARPVGAEASVDERWAGGPSEAERQAIVRQPPAERLEGTAVDLATIDRALLSGALLADAGALWRIDGSRRVAALAGCAGTREVVEMRGSSGRFAVRNLILPAQGLSIVLLTNRGAAGFGPTTRDGGLAIAGAAACP